MSENELPESEEQSAITILLECLENQTTELFDLHTLPEVTDEELVAVENRCIEKLESQILEFIGTNNESAVSQLQRGKEGVFWSQVFFSNVGQTTGPFNVGDLVGFNKILAVLDRGLEGIVYRAMNEILSEEVAVKVFDPLVENERVRASLRKRFIQGAKIQRRDSSRNIVRGYEIGEQSGFLYFVMGYAEGETLRQTLTSGGMLSVTVACSIVQKIFETIVDFEQRKIVHRDLKPENIIADWHMKEEGGADYSQKPKSVVVLDVGLAHISGSDLTEIGTVIGTPGYMAPEQAGALRLIDSRADVYSATVILYELLVGRLPRKRRDSNLQVERINQIQGRLDSLYQEKLEDKLEESLPRLQQFISSGLESNRQNRFSSAQEALTEFNKITKFSETLNSETKSSGALKVVTLALCLVFTVFLLSWREWIPRFDSLIVKNDATKNDAPSMNSEAKRDNPPAATAVNKTNSRKLFSLLAPPEFVKTDTVTLQGTVNDTEATTVWVNSEAVELNEDGEFSHKVAILKRSERIEIRAQHSSGATDQRAFDIRFDDSKPTMALDAVTISDRCYIERNGVLSGKINEENLRSLTINNMPISYSKEGRFVHKVVNSWEPGTKLEILALDLAGNELRKELQLYPPVRFLQCETKKSIVSDRTCKISGRTNYAGVAIFVAGKKVWSDQRSSYFSFTLNLQEGANTILVIVKAEDGSKDLKTLNVNFDSTKPVIQVQDKVENVVATDRLGRISGVVSDNIKTEKLLVDDQSVALNSKGDFASQAFVDREEPYLVQLSAIDQAGNQTFQKIRVFTKSARRALLADAQSWCQAGNAAQDLVILAIGKRLTGYTHTKTAVYGPNKQLRIASYRHNKTGLELNLIPGGLFTMGDNKSRDPSEKPERKEVVAPLLVGRTEIPISAWNFRPRPLGQTDQQPVTSKSWNEVQEWLKTCGGQLRLLQESEWEYSARALTNSNLFIPIKDVEKYCWIAQKKAVYSVFDHDEFTNAFGLSDMLGGVWEMTKNNWAPDLGANSKPDPAMGVLRGGSFQDSSGTCRVTLRFGIKKNLAQMEVGFRVGRSLPE